MSENTIDNENNSKAAPDPAKPKGKRKPAKKAKPAKNVSRAKMAAVKPKADRANKNAEVIEMMKRAKGATLPEIMKATAGSGTQCAALSASWIAREARRSSRPRTPRANERTRSGNNVRQLVVQEMRKICASGHTRCVSKGFLFGALAQLWSHHFSNERDVGVTKNR